MEKLVQALNGETGKEGGMMKMKVECPVCGVQGILEQRGNSSRVLHYKGFFNGKRVYEKHSIKMGVMGINRWE